MSAIEADRVQSPAVWLKPEELHEWDAFVGRHPLGLVYHLTSWKRTLERTFDHIEGHFLALREDKSGEIVAGLPVYVIRSWLLGNRIVSIPFASVCDPLVSSPSQLHQLLPAVSALEKESSSKGIEIRTAKTSSWLAGTAASVCTLYRHQYLPLAGGPDQLLGNFGKTAIRQGISRATRLGIRVVLRHDGEALRVFYDLFVESRKNLSLPPIPFAFFDSLLESFDEKRVAVFLATLEHRAIGGLLAIEFKGTFHIEHTGGTPDGDRMGTSKLLYWEAIKQAWAMSCRTVSFGRTSVLNPGLMKFKQRWGTSEEPIAIFQVSPRGESRSDWFEQARGNKLARWLFGHAPSAVRKRLGAMIYHHRG